MNWLLIVTGLIFLWNIIQGWRRGFVKILFSLLGIFVALGITYAVTPVVSEYISNHTGAYEKLEEKCAAGARKSLISKNEEDYAARNMYIELFGIELPEGVEDIMEGADKDLVDSIMDSMGIYDLIGKKIAGMIMKVLVFAGCLIIILLIIKIAYIVMNTAAHLPVISTVNRMGGMALGILKSFLISWIIVALLVILGGTRLGKSAIECINANSLLGYIYSTDIFLFFLKG